MGTKLQPGTFDCYHAAAPDEPMFILLARDPLAPTLARLWAKNRLITRGESAKVREAMQCADAMDLWRAQSSPVKPAEERHE